MKRILCAILTIAFVLTMTACAMQEKKVEKGMKQPINCATAEGDLRVLEKEKNACGGADWRWHHRYCSD